MINLLAAFMYLIDVIVIFWTIILVISSLIGTQNYNIFYLITFLIFAILNFISLKKINKENGKIEFYYFNLIKECSKFVKEEKFEELYYYLRKLRKTKWYKNIDKETSISPHKNLNEFYDIDEFKIDYFEK